MSKQIYIKDLQELMSIMGFMDNYNNPIIQVNRYYQIIYTLYMLNMRSIPSTSSIPYNQCENKS